MPHQRYEIALYNQNVRDSLSRGERPRQFSEDWSEIRYIEVAARDREELHDKLERRYPARRGFVIEHVAEID